MSRNRVSIDSKGRLDEVCTDGGAHLEDLGRGSLFLSCQRADGSSVAIWIKGRVSSWEEQEAPTCKACGKGIPANSPADEHWLMCPACGWSARPVAKPVIVK